MACTRGQLEYGPPIDFSFKDLQSIEDALYEQAESGWPANPPLIHVDPENPVEAPLHPPRPPVTVNAVALKLSNNRMFSLSRLDSLLNHVLEQPQRLQWLDLSCNVLERIPAEILDLSNLSVLYLHANKISNLSDVAKLAALRKLVKLTLHGNPVAACASYRRSVPYHLKGLRSLDFTAITRVDQECIANYSRGHEKRLAAR